MKKLIISLFFIPLFSLITFAQGTWTSAGCTTSTPSLKMVVVDGCGDEWNTEYVVFKTGSSPYDPTGLNMVGSSGTGPTANGFSGTNATSIVSTLNSWAGCGTPFIAAGATIPANATVWAFPGSGGLSSMPVQSLAAYCGMTIYIVSGNYATPSGFYTNGNGSAGNKTLTVSFTGCTTTVTYTNGGVSGFPNGNGANITQQGATTTSQYNNPTGDCFPVPVSCGTFSSTLGNPSPGSTTICAGQQPTVGIGFSLSAAPGPYTITLQPSGGGAPVVVTTNPTGTFTNITLPAINTTTTYTYTSVTNGALCPGSTSGSVTITVSAPMPVINVTNNCGSSLLAVSPAFTTYTWNPVAGNVQSQTVTTAGTYNVTVTNASGCTGTATKVVTITSNTLTMAPLPNITVCGGANVPLSVPGAPTPVTYNWTGPGGFSSMSATPTLSPAVAGTYNVTVTNANACTWTSQFMVSVTQPPVTPTVVNPVTVCEGQAINLQATGIPPLPFFPPGTLFTWTNPANVVIGSTATVTLPNGTPSMSGTYSVVIGSTFAPVGCVSLPATVQVTVTPNTVINLTPATICANAGVANLSTLFPTAPAGGTWSGTGVSFSSFNPSGLSGAISITYTPAAGSCAQPVNTTINVNPIQTITLGAAPTVCQTSASINLNTLLPAGAPTGGTWSGTGVTTPNFNPTGLSGNVTVTYTPPTPNTGCYNSPTATITVTTATTPALTSGTTCQSNTNFNLNTLLVTPTAGVWSGAGVSGSTFDATGLTGSVTLTFTPSASCTNPATTTITITATQPITTVSPAICQNASQLSLNLLISSPTPAPAGTWSGNGVTGTSFSPIGLSGANVLTFTPSGSCGQPVTATVTVNPAQTLTLTTPPSICQTAAPLDLTTLLPAGAPAGTWSGGGVVGTNFNPTGLSGSLVTFTPNPPNNGCFNSPSVTVTTLVPIQYNLQNATICQTLASLDLNTLLPLPNPAGAWSGSTGITGSSFNPNGLSGNITLTFTPSAPCTLPSTTTIVVNVPTTASLLPVTTCANGAAVNLNVYLPAGVANGIWSGAGIASSPIFSPTGLSGAQTLTYTPQANSCALPSNLTLTVNPTQQPVLKPGITVCQSQGLINLNTYLDPAFTTGTWSGSGTSGTNFNPNGLSGNITLTFTSNAPCTLTATTTFNVTTAQTPILGSANLCQTASAINLATLTDPNFPSGTWSGAGVSTVGPNYYFTPTGLVGNQFLTFTPAAGGCANTAQAAIFVNLPQAPQLKTKTLCVTQSSPLNLTTLEDSNFPGGTWSGAGVTGSQFSTTGLSVGNYTLTYTPQTTQCASIVTTTVTLTGSITPTLKPATICQNNAPLNLNTLADPLYTAGTWSGTGTSGTTFNPNGLSGAITLTFSPTGNCLNSANTTVTVATPIGFGNLKQDCQANVTQYIVSFDINGGLAPYTVTGGTGTLVGTKFTSALISVGTAYNFIINDASGCNPVVVSGNQITCGCITDAGTMNIAARTVCVGDSVCAVHNGNQVLQPDDMLQFVIHDKSGISLGTIFDKSLTPCFKLIAPMQAGVTYYISAIAGNKVLNNVDLTDPCLKVAQGTPVKWVTPPTAAFAKDTTMCFGDSTALKITLTGNPVWNLTYSENGVSKIVNNINTSPYFLKVKPNATSTYIITKVNSNGLCANAATSQAKVIVNPLTSLTISKDTTICLGQTVSVNSKFVTGTGTLLWYNSKTTSSIDVTPIADEVVSVVGTQNGCSAKAMMNINVNQPITVAIDKDQTICDGENATLIASGATTYAWKPGNQTASAITVTPTATTLYTVIGTKGACKDTATATVTVLKKITVTVKDSCLANNTQFVTILTISGGQSPYTITGGTGNLIGNKYYATPTNLGTAYSFNIDDNSSCTSASVNGVLNTCKCDALAGTMKKDTLFACPNDIVTATSLKDYVLGKKDTIQYILHDTPLAQQGNILATSFIPQFTLSTIAGIVPNKVYYISTIVGAKNNANAVNLTDGCLSIALGTPVILKTTPSAILAGSYSICKGTSIKLSLTVKGALPIKVNYSSNSAVNALTINALPYDFTVSPTLNTTYTLTAISDKYCTGTASGVALVQVNDATSKLVEETRCQGEQIQFGNVIYKKSIDTSFVLKNKAGCDSLVTLKLKFLKKDSVTVAKTLCSGAFITVNGNKYDINKPNGTELLTNKNGCDSVVLVKLTFNGSGGLSVVAQSSPKFAGFGVSCFGVSDGEAKAIVTGGTAPFTYKWDNGYADPNIFGLAPGTYRVTVTDAAGCVGDNFVVLKEPKRLDIYAKAQDPTCFNYKDGGILIDSITGGAKGFKFSLDGGKNFTKVNAFPFRINNLAQGNYTVIANDANGCSTNFKLALANPPQLKLDLGPDITTEAGKEITLNPKASFNVAKFKWLNTKYFECDTCYYPKVKPLLTQTYALDVFDKNGCYATDAITLYAFLIRRVFVPNVFSPNVDGTNDKLRIFCGEGVLRIVDFRIFDRWGNMVFEDGNYSADESPDHGWDGTFRNKVMNNDVFAYSVRIEFTDGKIEDFKGDITIVK